MAVRERTEEVRHVEFRAAEDSDGQTLEGYAAVFNEWTDIRDSVGTYRERIAPGAFKRSIGQRTPVLQFDHGQHPLIGSIPLGAVSALREDRNGLFIRARLSDNWLIEPVRHAIADRAITGMSFRFRVVSDQWENTDDGEERTITEVELLELGPVVFPAYEQTSVDVRSLVGALDDETRAALARELSPDDEPDELPDAVVCDADPDTSAVAAEPVNDDSPDEPPVASHENNRNRIAESLDAFRRHEPKERPDVDQ